MIEIKKVTEPERFTAVKEGERLFAAVEDGKMTGFCKYKLDGRTVVLLELTEHNGDILLADGIARAAIASCRGDADRVKCERTGLLPAFMALSGHFDANGEAALEAALNGRCAANNHKKGDAE